MILNRPVYLIQLKFLLSSNTGATTVPWSMQIVIRVRDRSTRSQSGECTSADFGRGFTVRDHRHAQVHARMGLCVSIAGLSDPGETHFDPWIISRDSPSDSAISFPSGEKPENVVGKPVG